MGGYFSHEPLGLREVSWAGTEIPHMRSWVKVGVARPSACPVGLGTVGLLPRAARARSASLTNKAVPVIHPQVPQPCTLAQTPVSPSTVYWAQDWWGGGFLLPHFHSNQNKVF